MQRTTKEIEQELLVLQAQSGDRKALHQIVECWHPRLLRHALFLTKRSEVAAEAVQDAWISVIKSLRQLRDPASFKAWVFRIVQNRAMDLMRRESRKRSALVNMVNQSAVAETRPRNEKAFDSNTLRAAIESLTSELQNVLRLYYTEEMSVKEVSHVIGIAEGTVKHRLFRARQQLKTLLTIEEQDDERERD